MPSGRLTGQRLHAPCGDQAGATTPRLRGGRLRTALFGGGGRVVGVVTVAGAPAARRVRLFELKSGLLVGETWSSAEDGAYSFDWVSTDHRYLVLAHDHLEQYNAAVADLIEPEPMS